MTTEERRKEERIQAYRAVELSSAEKARRCGVTRNASRGGLLIATPSRFAPGDDLAIDLHLDGGVETVRGRVVRVEVTPPDAGEAWRFWVAVHLDPAISPELLEEATKPPPSQRDPNRAS